MKEFKGFLGRMLEKKTTETFVVKPSAGEGSETITHLTLQEL